MEMTLNKIHIIKSRYIIQMQSILQFVVNQQIYRTHQNQMAQNNPFSVLDSTFCYINSMIHREHHKDYQLWDDPFQKKQYSEYKLYGWPNQKQMEIYQFRKEQQKNLVQVHYIAPFDNAGFKQFRIFVEYIPIILSSLHRLSFSSALYILRESLIGFETIFKKYGYVHIDDRLIGLNSQGNVKVWLNQNFAYNGASQTGEAPKWMNQQWKATQMVSCLFSLIQDRLQRNDKLKQFKKQKQLKLTSLSFQKAIQFVNNYAKVHNVNIPSQTPELLIKSKQDNSKKVWMKNQDGIKEPLVFKKLSSIIRRNSSKNKNSFQTSPKKKKRDKPDQSCLTRQHNFKLYSPGTSVQKNVETRRRNRSEATMSIAQSKAKTSINNGRFQKSPRKYFNQKSTRPRVQSFSKDYNTLQSSLISGDMFFSRGNNHLKFANKNPIMQQFQFTQIQIQNNKPSHKKRKYSAADQVTFHAQSLTPNAKNNTNVSSSLARSMVVKHKQQSSNRFQQNPEQQVKKGLVPSKYCLQFPIEAKNSSIGSNRATSPMRDDLQSHEITYKSNKPFLNYKAIKNSIINQTNKEQVKDEQTSQNLKNSFLKNMEMKSSQIILQRSSEYASLQDILKPIKESGAETPMSGSLKNDQIGFSQLQNERTSNLFVASVGKKRRGSDNNISNSTTDRKSNFMCQRKEGLINFASPKSTVRSGMFKSIFVGELKSGIKEVPQGDIQ